MRKVKYCISPVKRVQISMGSLVRLYCLNAVNYWRFTYSLFHDLVTYIILVPELTLDGISMLLEYKNIMFYILVVPTSDDKYNSVGYKHL